MWEMTACMHRVYTLHAHTHTTNQLHIANYSVFNVCDVRFKACVDRCNKIDCRFHLKINN